jgi:hypothetical protein
MTPAVPKTRAIPITAWVVAGIVFLATAVGLGVWFIRDQNTPLWAMLIFPVLGPTLLAANILLIGYVYGDAKRRGMRYVMWTWLAILIPNAMGIVLYFILRDPMPVYCSHCGGMSKPGFAYCPRCGVAMAPCCPGCRRVSQKDWTHCAYCGTALA